MTRAFLRVSLLFVLVARFAAPAAAFAHPRRSDVLGSGPDTATRAGRSRRRALPGFSQTRGPPLAVLP